MKLTTVRVSGFRSFTGQHAFQLSDGLTCLVGPNNAGKSNLIDAVALVLSPDLTVDPERDLPRMSGVAQTRSIRVELTFQSDHRPDQKTPSSERGLLRRARAYEQHAYREHFGAKQGATGASVPRPRTFHASQGKIVRGLFLRSQGGQVIRKDYFGVPGLTRVVPTSRTSPYPLPGTTIHDALFRDFSRQLLFVSIRSGESLESFLAGPFKRVLELTIAEHLKTEMRAADRARTTYARHLEDALLSPLSRQIRSVASTLFEGVTDVQLVPGIPQIAETLGSMNVTVSDAITSDLRFKGTGVRAGVIAASLAYLREGSTRSMIFAIEEPESFLHPSAQRDLRDALASMAAKPDVTVMATTHSPFMIPLEDTGSTLGVSKDAGGRSKVDDDPRRDHAGSLFDDPGLYSAIDRAEQIERDTRFVVLTEGDTDRDYLLLAARLAGRQDLVEGVQFIPVGGATKMPAEAVLTAQLTSKPVVILLDSDDAGRRAARQIEAFRRQPNRLVVKVGSIRLPGRQPLDAEDLWPPDLIRQMREGLGNPETKALKASAAAWLAANARRSDASYFVQLLELLNRKASTVLGESV